MKPRLLEILRCPACIAPLETSGDVLACRRCGRAFPVVDSVPRFAGSDNYTGNFGFQWNEFSRTQLDSHSGVPISRERFLAQTKWDAPRLAGRLVLDAGCGSGRFAEIALSLGAEVVAIDYSTAVDATQRNLGTHPRLHVVQADIYALPFAPETFDLVYSLGVLQHTPDVRRAVTSLVPMLKRGGALTLDFYLRRWQNLLEPKYWLRPVTARISQRRLFRIVRAAAPPLLGVSRALSRLPLVGRFLRRLVPVANYAGVYPLDDQQLREWAILDTFDWLGPRFDHPQTAQMVRQWLEAAGLQDIEIEHVRHLTARAVKRSAA
jgi:SAM-dependent methyltransferase